MMMTNRGKKYREAAANIDREQRYDLEIVVKFVKGGSSCKFDEMIDIVV
jgi:ribosomal protein L1